MPTYLRAYVPGGTFFFTLVTYRRQPLLRQPGVRQTLRNAIKSVQAKRPFRIDAFVLLTNHLHMIWTLPEGDADFSTRWRLIKHQTTRQVTQLGRVGHDPPYVTLLHEDFSKQTVPFSERVYTTSR